MRVADGIRTMPTTLADRPALLVKPERADAICEVSMSDAGVLLDFDTPDTLSALAGSESHR